MKITEIEDDKTVATPTSAIVRSASASASASSTKSYTICLNMIVKNESHIIESTLINLCKYIDLQVRPIIQYKLFEIFL